MIVVTGADGFVGRWLLASLRAAGEEVVGAVRDPAAPSLPSDAWRRRLAGVRWVPLDLGDAETVAALLDLAPRAIVHLAAVASGAEARARPSHAWDVNVLGTVRLVHAIERSGRPVRLVFASTGEVYGRGVPPFRPFRETDPVAPCSPYAASKAAAELAVLEGWRRFGLDAIIARCFAQAGPGQRPDFVIPALARRMLEAQASGARSIAVGNLEPVREFVDVRDVADALARLASAGAAGQVVNVAAARATPLRAVAERMRHVLGFAGGFERETRLLRQADLEYLVGDGAAMAALGWMPKYDLDQTLADVADDIRGAIGDA